MTAVKPIQLVKIEVRIMGYPLNQYPAVFCFTKTPSRDDLLNALSTALGDSGGDDSQFKTISLLRMLEGVSKLTHLQDYFEGEDPVTPLRSSSGWSGTVRSSHIDLYDVA